VLAVLSIVVGNLWYVVHRFTLHNVLDLVCYYIRPSGSEKHKCYTSWLSEHIQKSFSPPTANEELRNFVHFRSSQVILLFIVAEALILFSIINECGSFFWQNHVPFLIIGIVIAFFALMQYWISNNIDVDVVNRSKATAEK
jgi:uncharacterized ion transporter superfamily protein YfcC